MQNGKVMAANTEKTAKEPRFKLLRMVIYFIAIYFGLIFVMSLQTTAQAVILTIGLVGYSYPKVAAVVERLHTGGKEVLEGGKRVVSRISRVASAVSKMDDEEFSSRFPDATPAPEAPEKDKPSFVPSFLCKPALSKEKALAIAEAWWDEEDGNGMTGMMKVNELCSAISCDDPTKHTAVLTDYEELNLPTERAVLEQLVEVVRANGLAADINPDSQITVFWNQYSDGSEAANDEM